MEEMYQEMIKELNSYQLQDIYSVNKLKLQGFRNNSRNSQTKSTRMKQDLTKKRYLKEYFSKTIEYYLETQKKDYSWALIENLSDEEINKRIRNENIGDVLFALLSADKYEHINKLVSLQKHDQLISTVDIDMETTDVKNNDDLVIELRNIINVMEEKNSILNTKISEINKRNQSVEEENHDLKKLNKKIEKELVDKLEKENGKNYLLKEKKSEIISLEVKIEEYAEYVSNLERLNLLVVGGESIELFWEKHALPIKKIDYSFLDFDDFKVSELIEYDQMLIMSFSLNRNEFDLLKDESLYQNYDAMKRCIYLNSPNETILYLESVRRYYER